jgi:hypothetical protein
MVVDVTCCTQATSIVVSHITKPLTATASHNTTHALPHHHRQTREEITEMGVEEVCDLLRRIGLDRFTSVFSENMITGVMFLQLDDTMLK